MPNLSRQSPAFLQDLADEALLDHHSAHFSKNQALHAKSYAAEAFFSLPLVIQNALFDQQRIVFIANNPSITTATLENFLKPTDILVLFNHFIHAEFFASHPVARALPKLLFFRQIGDSNLHFGMPPRDNHVDQIAAMQSASTVGMMFANIAYQFPAPSDEFRIEDGLSDSPLSTLPASVKAAIDNPKQCRILPETHPVVSDYPIFSHIHSSAPTSGFLLYRLLIAARYYVKQEKKSSDIMTMIMLGFNDEDKTGHFWEGHNWKFERFELANPPLGVERISQY